MAKLTTFYKVIEPRTNTTIMQDSQNIGDQGAFSNYTWYQRLVQGSAARIQRYREYDMMDSDVEVSRALDTITEEILGGAHENITPFKLNFFNIKNDDPQYHSIVSTLKTSLKYWSDIHEFEIRLFPIVRTTIKYGDFFALRKNNTKKWNYIQPKHIIGAIVAEDDMTEVVGWQIRTDTKRPNSPYNQQFSGYGNPQTEGEPIDARDIVWISINNDIGETAPFGESILRPAYRAQKQKELLEDAIVIYRLVRAPERRVFYIDVGNLPPPKIKAALEQFKNEYRQRKVPTFGGGTDQVDTVYNPHCIVLDTEIPLMDGRILTLEELIEEFKDGKENWVYSIDIDTSEIVPGPITWAGITRKDTQVIKITFDNGKELTCTPDHKIPVRGVGYVEAKDIKSSDELYNYEEGISPFSRTITKVTNIEYLTKTMDVGTLTIDGDEKHFKHHNFAIASGIFIKNSMIEDIFLASREGGRGTKVDPLPGGHNLGNLEDLDYFQNKVYEALRVPISYMKLDGGATFSDGRVGTAYIQELRFSLYVQRLQKYFSKVFDKEFKRFLHSSGINIDSSIYSIELHSPENFGKDRQRSMDAELLTVFSNVTNIPWLSPRMAQTRFLQFSDEEVATNEKLRCEELGIDPKTDKDYLKKIYLTSEEGIGGGMMGGGMGGIGGGMIAEPPMGPEDLTNPQEPSQNVPNVGQPEQNMTQPL